jgi:prepilin-type N-terminal cleavage/methylation domain-containing protein
MRKPIPRSSPSQSGFTLVELMMATLVLLFGIVAVAQLVPLAVSLNSSSRQDSTALVIAQRVLGQMLDVPLTATTCNAVSAPACPDAQAAAWSLGDPTNPGQLVGSAVNLTLNPPLMDFTVAPQTGYNFNYVDPNDPSQLTYDVRWAVVTLVNSGGAVTGKRFVVGVRRVGGRPILPVTLDTLVQK